MATHQWVFTFLKPEKIHVEKFFALQIDSPELFLFSHQKPLSGILYVTRTSKSNSNRMEYTAKSHLFKNTYLRTFKCTHTHS